MILHNLLNTVRGEQLVQGVILVVNYLYFCTILNIVLRSESELRFCLDPDPQKTNTDPKQWDYHSANDE
jgi:hypothetical protein